MMDCTFIAGAQFGRLCCCYHINRTRHVICHELKRRGTRQLLDAAASTGGGRRFRFHLFRSSRSTPASKKLALFFDSCIFLGVVSTWLHALRSATRTLSSGRAFSYLPHGTKGDSSFCHSATHYHPHPQRPRPLQPPQLFLSPPHTFSPSL